MGDDDKTGFESAIEDRCREYDDVVSSLMPDGGMEGIRAEARYAARKWLERQINELIRMAFKDGPPPSPAARD